MAGCVTASHTSLIYSSTRSFVTPAYSVSQEQLIVLHKFDFSTVFETHAYSFVLSDCGVQIVDVCRIYSISAIVTMGKTAIFLLTHMMYNLNITLSIKIKYRFWPCRDRGLIVVNY